MKVFERILLYSVLMVLVFYVFLVDGNVESQVAIQEEIRARSIVIVNDAGQEVLSLCALETGGTILIADKAGTPITIIGINKEGNGLIGIANKAGTPGVTMKVDENGGRVSIMNKDGTCVAYMSVNEYDGGEISIANKDGTFVAFMGAPEDDGIIGVLNKHGKRIGSLP